MFINQGKHRVLKNNKQQQQKQMRVKARGVYYETRLMA